MRKCLACGAEHASHGHDALHQIVGALGTRVERVRYALCELCHFMYGRFTNFKIDADVTASLKALSRNEGT